MNTPREPVTTVTIPLATFEKLCEVITLIEFLESSPCQKDYVAPSVQAAARAAAIEIMRNPA